MKLKQFGLLTAASLALVACSNESDPVLGGEDNAPKKVVLKLEGISQGTKSTDANTENTDAGKKVSLYDVAIFLYDEGGYIYETKEISSSSTDDWGKLSSGIEFTNVDPAVDNVLVIGNYDNLETNASIGTAASWEGKEASALLSTQLTLKSQNQSAEEKPYQGSSSVSSTKAKMTLFGKGALSEVAGTGDGIKSYEATVQIKPIVSRLEVKSVSCKFVDPAGSGLPTKPSKVTVAGIGLFDYYNTMTLDGTTLNGLMDATKIAEPDAGTTGGQTYEFLASGGDWEWAYNPTATGYNNELTESSGELKTNPGDAKSTFAYNFFPVVAGTNIGATPSTSTQQVLANVRLSVTVNDDDDKKYVVTTSFKDAETGGSIVTPDAGKIYQFDYAFETDNIRDNWGSDEIKVTVKVTVLNWEIEQVYPEF